jgi:hypothetical protein
MAEAALQLDMAQEDLAENNYVLNKGGMKAKTESEMIPKVAGHRCSLCGARDKAGAITYTNLEEKTNVRVQL